MITPHTILIHRITFALNLLLISEIKNVRPMNQEKDAHATPCLLYTSATVRPGVMQKIDPIADAKPEVIEYNPGFTPDNKYIEILDIVKNVADVVDIQDAKILVSGGRGVGTPENFKMLEELAEVVGGTVSLSLIHI